ncbi:MAG: prepilin-type N-terminal cleavage/methylation domain-containing protein [Verrucomicrobiota bacterium]|jgi:type II secretion system protein J
MKLEKKSRRGAFTLIEIMIAIAIFGMIVAAIYSTWVLILKSSRVGQEAAAQIQRERITVRTIEDALTCIQSFQSSMQYYYFLVQNGDQPMLSFTARLPGNFPRNGRFGDFNLRRLTFTVEAGPDSERNLVLRQNPILMDMDLDEQSYPLVLARDVKKFAVECLDTNSGWVTEWNDTNSIPLQVRYTLVAGGNGPGWAITNVVTMQSSTLPGVVQMPRGSSSGPGGHP